MINRSIDEFLTTKTTMYKLFVWFVHGCFFSRSIVLDWTLDWKRLWGGLNSISKVGSNLIVDSVKSITFLSRAFLIWAMFRIVVSYVW